ncbi:MAG: PQQ-binding-like beta-propeller repeat protein [Vulcanimicrobiota bacterium]
MEIGSHIPIQSAGISSSSQLRNITGSTSEPASDAKPPGDGFTGGVSAPLLKNLSSQIASKMIFDNDFSTLTWKLSLPCQLSAQPVVGNNEKVYIGSDNGTVMCVDIKSGRKDWQFSQKDSRKISDPIQNEKGELIVLADLSKVLILDGTSGEKKHELNTDTFSPSSPAWGPNGTVIITSMADGVFNKQGKIYALDPWQKTHSSIFKTINPFYREHPEKLWEVTLDQKSFDLSIVNPDGKPRNVARLDDTIFYSDGEKRLVALDEADGRKKWQFPMKADALFDPFIIDKNTIGSATRDTLFALDAKTGKQLWTLNGECVFGAPSSDGNGKVFYRPGPDSLVAIEDGAIKWKKKTGFSPLIIPPVTDKFGGVYIIENSGNKTTISALDGETGDLKFKLNAKGDVAGAPVVSPEGKIIVKMRDGDRESLCCYESPFNPEISGSIPESSSPAIEQCDGWVSIGGVNLQVKK